MYQAHPDYPPLQPAPCHCQRSAQQIAAPAQALLLRSSLCSLVNFLGLSSLLPIQLMDNCFPVSDLWILLIIERATATYHWDMQEVVLLRWRRSIPFQRISIPGIGAGLLAILQTGDEVVEKHHYRETDHESTNRCHQVQLVPATSGGIGVDTARHTEHSQQVHGEEGKVHTDQHQPEMNLSHTLTQELPGYLGEPVVETREDGEDAATEEHIVDMRHHKVAISYLVVERYDSQGRAIQTADQEHSNEPKGEDHRCLKANLTSEDSCQPVEDLHSSRDSNQRRAGSEECLRNGWQTDSKHVVCPHREDQDIHLRVPKGPEEMLPEQRITSKCILVEMRTNTAIQQQQYASRSQAG